ncbi:hypothetical protein FSP39_011760 [Pinctada imbricata]|uniref:Uncharacterized protein n=1 Tax=Pinctada imbricata TaxID=66713 RepID=A0AA89BW95_PINIB|nr:hypothetical protein FSP39_011760 [Pinctada imbricata]
MDKTSKSKHVSPVVLSAEVKKISIQEKDVKFENRSLGKLPGHHEKLLDQRLNMGQTEESAKYLRKRLYSPAPSKANNIPINEDIIDLTENVNFPHITVQKCEDGLPDITSGQKLSSPEYVTVSRSGSSTSLEIPSPVMERRSQGGREISVLLPGNLQTSLSRSEGCLYTDLAKPKKDVKGAEVVPSGGLRKSTRPSLQSINPHRKITRSASPRMAKRIPCTDITFIPPKAISDR